MDDPRWAIPVALAVAACKLRLLQPSAAAGGLLVGLAVIYSPQQPQHAAMLLVFFVAGSGATKLTARLRGNKQRQAAGAQLQSPTKGPAAGAAQAAGRRRGRSSRSPSATLATAAAAAADHVALSDAGDAKRGRSLEQVLATGLVPALLCLGREGWHPDWQLAYLCYLAACAGDTLASEFGSLSSRPPLLVTTLQPVAVGTDGGISLPGTLASLAGGALVGGCTGTVKGLLQGGPSPGTLLHSPPSPSPFSRCFNRTGARASAI